jgi:hypothetical protein
MLATGRRNSALGLAKPLTEVDMVLARIVQAPLAYPRVQGDTPRACTTVSVRDLLPRDVR